RVIVVKAAFTDVEEDGRRVGRPSRGFVRRRRLRNLTASVQHTTYVCRSAAGRGDKAEVIVRGVGSAGAGIVEIGDPLAVGRPGWRRAGAGGVRQAANGCPGVLRVEDIDVPDPFGVPVVATRGDARKLCAIWRPRG